MNCPFLDSPHVKIRTDQFVLIRVFDQSVNENNVDPDQNAPKEQSDLGLHGFLKTSCPNFYSKYGIYLSCRTSDT